MAIFDNQRTETLLCIINDTGVAGATLSLRMHGNHCFFEMKSPHAIFSLLNSSLEDLKKLRRGVKKAIKLHEEYVKKGKEEIAASRTQTDLRVAEIRKEKTTDRRGNKTSKVKSSNGNKNTGKKQTKKD
jgi:hypothetical protein